MAQMQPKAPAFDFTSPQGQAALMNALGAGVSLDGISGLRDFLSPKRNTTKLGENDTLVDDDGNVVGQGRMKPMEPQKRSTDSVVADIAYRYSRGEQISPREMELYRLWSAQERKQGQWAPKVGGGKGEAPAGPVATGRKF
jgi:CHASE2 domain-containing sensor protein